MALDSTGRHWHMHYVEQDTLQQSTPQCMSDELICEKPEPLGLLFPPPSPAFFSTTETIGENLGGDEIRGHTVRSIIEGERRRSVYSDDLTDLQQCCFSKLTGQDADKWILEPLAWCCAGVLLDRSAGVWPSHVR